MLSKEMIETRRENLLKGLEQKRAEINALIGAIQDCDYWLTKIAEEVEED